ncbi:MAG: glycosyltransferase [Chloroflexi bacterium]|nr:glycosyltransferase [Chloroflexota bacterium]
MGPQKTAGTETQPLVSVVVTTKNEEKNIGNCLQSIKDQTYPSLEIIVVDNDSSDQTKDVARRYTDRVYDKGPERSAQRNFGVARATGKYVLYLDADMILSREVVAECVHQCGTEGSVASYIPERVVGQGFWIRVRDFERSFYDASCIDAVRFVRRDKFLEVGGFDEQLSGPEDWDFDRRIRASGDCTIVRSALYHNEGAFNLRTYLAKKGYYTTSLDQYIGKWGKDDPIVRKQLGLYYRLAGVFVENGKWKKLVKHPLLTIGVLSLRGMVGITYLKMGTANVR